MEASTTTSHSTACDDYEEFYFFDAGTLTLADRLNRVKERLQKELDALKSKVEPEQSRLTIAAPDAPDEPKLESLLPDFDDLKDDITYLDQRMARIENSLDTGHAYQNRLSTQLNSLSCQIVDLETRLKDRMWTMEREIASFEESRWSTHVPRMLLAKKDLETRLNVLLVLLVGLIVCIAMFGLWATVYKPGVVC